MMTSNQPAAQQIDDEQGAASPRVAVYPVRATGRPWWWYVTAGATALLLGLGSLFAIVLLAQPLAFLILGVAIATALDPGVEWLARWLPRTLAILLLYLAILLFIVFLGSLVAPDLLNQIQAFFTAVPTLISVVQQWLTEQQVVDAARLLNVLAPQLSQFGLTLVAAPLTLWNILLNLVLVISISIYSLLIGPGVRGFVLSLLPPERYERSRAILNEMGAAMGGYARAVMIMGVVIGVLTYVGLRLVGVNYPLMLAILAGMLEIIPIFGPIIAGGIITVIAFLQSPTQAVIVLLFFIALQQLESYVLFPNVMHHEIAISPLLVIFAFAAGSTLGGVLGAVVAIPLSAALQVLVLRVVAPAIRRRTGATASGGTDE
ncbi:MAG: AI-2E family transporter [Caldilinea sp. CFX5]|nr:AI-2E family transporter [Caldilinea sp. CFX5]